MAWLTQQALRADERRRAAEAEAELEQRVSLALWRMDTELAPIIAAEVIRPPSEFRPSIGPPVEPPQYVWLQFEARPKGIWVSPQAGLKQAKESARLAELRAAVGLPQLVAELPNTPLPTLADVGKSLAAVNSEAVGPNSDAENDLEFFANSAANQTAQEAAPQQRQVAQAPINGSKFSKEADFEQRSKRYQSAAQQGLINAEQRPAVPSTAPAVQATIGNMQVGKQPARELVGVSRPLWVGNRLVLARRVSVNGQTVVQGSWLDWPQLKAHLLAETVDLLPKADLARADDNGSADPSRMLAGLPVRLVVGERAVAAAAGPTLRWALGIGWGAVLLAVIAAAFLMQGVIKLSERRAAFVSSVTHELRTPLTTFRMYAEMLARGMVPDANQRQDYFNTLRREAERLTLLVENVLAYARLERGRRPQAQDCITLASLIERTGPRLKQRAAQAGMQCELQLDDAAANEEFTTDQGVVEQILFNLVDNASKYARDAADRRIHVEGGRNGQFVKLEVRDHGPGIGQRHRSRHMQPFSKSAQESADTAPGVGLGLALCRRLAGQLGGRLDVGATPNGGAVVTLYLPAS
ncbi:MAG TPA: HAMP domain-containing sensor histidine kinase [Lacipirellulaceae bacterium]|nr:HAMP domain-containing sensor histidine kinase [Lacipirellulaceae bacterium]